MYYCPLLTLVCLGFTGSIQAYIMDDANSTIQYSGYFIHFNSDDPRIYNSSYTDSDCPMAPREDNCGHIKIPFTGSGITVYSLIHYDAVNVTFSIDGGSTKSYQHGKCDPNYCYNVSTIDAQSLIYDNHILDITVVPYNGIASVLYFDYAVVNDIKPTTVASEPTEIVSSVTSATVTSTTVAFGAVTTSSAPSSTGNSTSPSHPSYKGLAVATGGIFGGLAAIAAIVLALLYIQKRNRSQTSTERNPTSVFLIDLPLPPQPAISNDRNPPVGIDKTTDASPVSIPISNIHSPLTPPHSGILSPPATLAQDSTPSNVPMVTDADATMQAHSVPAPVPMVANTIDPSHGLTEQQLGLVQHLLWRNMPIPVVADMVEGMLHGGGPSGDDSSRAGIDMLSETDAPPSYDFV